MVLVSRKIAMVKLIRLYLFSFFCALFFSPLCSFAAPTDFNGDGQSDPSSVSNSTILKWSSKILNNLETIDSDFGRLGHHLASGNYKNSKTIPATIRNTGNWVINDADQTTTISFGAEDALYIAGGNFNGNGLNDLAYSTNYCSKKSSTAEILLNPLTTSSRTSIPNGRGNHFKTFGDVNGDGRDEICNALPIKINGKITPKFRMICRDAITARKFRAIRLGQVNNTPLPVKRLGKSDLFLVYNKTRTTTNIRLINAKGRVLRKSKIPSTGVVLVGNYLPSTTTQQVAIVKDGVGTLYNIDTRGFSTVSFPEGIVFDDININSFVEDERNTCICKSSQIRKNGSCPKPKSSCEIQRGLTDGPGNWLHKPVSDNFPNSIVNLFNPSDDPSSCRYEDITGEVYTEARFTGYSNPNRPTWRASNGANCGDFPKPLVVGCIIKGKKNCWTIPNPCQRYD